MKCPTTDGTYKNVRFEDYLAWPLWSQSTIKEAKKSAAHARAARGMRVEPTDAMVLGTALHTAFLEPDEAAERIVMWEGKVRRGKEWDEFKSLYQDKIILTRNQTAQLAGMMNAMRNNKYIRDISEVIADVEVVEIGQACGLRCKARADALGLCEDEEWGWDIKKVATADPFKFQRAIIDYGYDLQGALYCELFELERFVLIAVEEDPPYDIVPYELSPAMLRNGVAKLQACAATIRQAEKTGLWPGRSAAPVLLEPPEWDMQTDITYPESETPDDPT